MYLEGPSSSLLWSQQQPLEGLAENTEGIESSLHRNGTPDSLGFNKQLDLVSLQRRRRHFCNYFFIKYFVLFFYNWS